jgi:predicted DCC family thiol-disulfide oxidoreductase YuxK
VAAAAGVPLTMLSATKNVPPLQFTLFRVLFGLYLLQHFLYLLPWSGEIFSNAGVLADPRLNATHGLLPNPLATAWGGTPAFVTGFIGLLAALSLAFTLGFARRTAAVLLWFGWACLFNRNNLISNPSLPYVGLILLFSALVPPGEPYSLGARRRRPSEWFFPAWIFRGAWWLMAAGYTFSGLVKLGSPSWVDGTAFRHLIDNPLARPGPIRDLFLGFPDWLIAAHTWAVLAAEILFLPLCLHRWGRLAAWAGMLVMHVGIILMVDFADLSFGMVMLHLFTFDPDWLRARGDGRQPVLLYDGECGLCNSVVRLLMREDLAARLKFAPLQSAPAQEFLRAQGLPTQDFDSIVFVPDWNERARNDYRLRTDGVLGAADEIGGLWRVLSWARALPAAWRDPAYQLVARFRYRLFGQYRPTPLPEADWEKRFVGRGEELAPTR